ncbi:hypothetical protein [Diaminobutyricimonas sp. TR449]|uniref:hypothetical protein n=1 Tax=Diaminobutyricimonas sp. TR449 TaxID=2708076 RepID=UPI00142169F6|nr:hypothetical protein [Diaminobutyricimonas sp. TR449]
MRRDAWWLSPQQADPLSWFANRYLPAAFALLAVVGGGIVMLLTWPAEAPVLPQVIAFVLQLLAFTVVGWNAAPNRPTGRAWHAVVPLILCWAGVVISAIGYAPGLVAVAIWWAPFTAALVLAALSLRNPAALNVVYAALTAVVCGVAALHGWTEHAFGTQFAVALIGAATPIVAGVACSIYCLVLAERVMVWRDRQVSAAAATPAETSLNHLRRSAIGRVGEEVTPFLDRIARVGMVSEADRDRAAELSRTARSVLVSRVQSSWLDDLVTAAIGSVPIRVSDPDRLAERMPAPQRSALRGLLRTAATAPVLWGRSIEVRLADTSHGGVLEVTLPLELHSQQAVELFAPFYLTLQAVTDGAEWDEGRERHLRFQLPPSNRT